MRHPIRYFAFLLLVLPVAAFAQGDDLSLKSAIQIALHKNPSVRAAAAAESEAEARLAQARSGYLPRVNYSESIERGNNPVYVFGTLLTQQRFTASNFALGSLNEPDAINNFQSQLSFDQVLFDGRQTALGVKANRFAQQSVKESTRRTSQETIEAVVQAYYRAVLAAENAQVAGEARKSAEANVKRAENLRDAGMTTDSDVLSLRVHLAGVRERQIQANNDLEVSRAALNDALGLPLETAHRLTTPLTAAQLPAAELAEYEKAALDARPEARQAFLATEIASVQKDLARSKFLPQIALHGVVEDDRAAFGGRGGMNWVAGVSLRFNLFNGFADKQRVAESLAAGRRADALRERAQSGIRLEVRRAFLDMRSAGQRVEVAQAAVAEAAESLRILQNRYEAGLATVTDLLRGQTAHLEARTRELAAVYDQRLAAVRLERATGRLTADSEVVSQ